MKMNILNKWVASLMSVIFIFPLLFSDILLGGEYKYDNYVWLSANQNLTENEFTDICFINEWDAMIAVSANKILYSKISYDPSWTKVKYPDTLQVNSIVLDQMGRIILQTKQQIWIKDNLNSDWICIELPSTNSDSVNQTVFSLYALGVILFTAGTDLFVYAESSWKTIPNPNHLLIQTVHYQQDTKFVFAGTEKQGIWSIDLFGGEQIKMQTKSGDSSVSHLFVSLNETNAFFASTKTGEIYRSFDKGKTWATIPSIGQNNEVFAFCEDEARIGVFFAFSRLGVYLTVDHGTEWIPMQHLIEETEVRTGFYHPYEERYYIATLGKGIRNSFAVPNQPAPILPKNGANTYYFNPMLAWELFGGNDLPGSYHVLVSSAPDFKVLVYEKQHVVGDSIIVPENVLTLHTPYFWKVRVETQYWDSDWSEISAFTLRQRWLFTPNQPIFQWNEQKHRFHNTENIIPFLEKNVLFLPVRSFMEKTGALIDWDPESRQITIIYNKITKRLPLNPNLYDIQIRNNRSFIPLRHLAECFDWNADWDAIKNIAIMEENHLPTQ